MRVLAPGRNCLYSSACGTAIPSVYTHFIRDVLYLLSSYVTEGQRDRVQSNLGACENVRPWSV